jgi:hypothetical protein
MHLTTYRGFMDKRVVECGSAELSVTDNNSIETNPSNHIKARRGDLKITTTN